MSDTLLKIIKKIGDFKIFAFLYVFLGLLIVLFPPQFKHLPYENKFKFFINVDKVDFYFFAYEVISYLLIGSVVYFLFFKGVCCAKVIQRASELGG